MNIPALPQLIEDYRDLPAVTLRDRGRLALRRAVRAWVKDQGN